MITYAELVAAIAGTLDVELDQASRELDLVLERVRSLGGEGRAKLRAALTTALEAASIDVRRAREAAARHRQRIEDWRARSASAAGHAPTLAAEARERAAELEANRDHEIELAEYQATLETLQRALALLDQTSGLQRGSDGA